MVTLMNQRSSISQIVLLVVMMKLLKTEHLEPVDSPQTTNDSVSSDPCTHFLAQGIRATSDTELNSEKSAALLDRRYEAIGMVSFGSRSTRTSTDASPDH
jgi:hypothetical protein